jgi:hypothetical protein
MGKHLPGNEDVEQENIPVFPHLGHLQETFVQLEQIAFLSLPEKYFTPMQDHRFHLFFTSGVTHITANRPDWR